MKLVDHQHEEIKRGIMRDVYVFEIAWFDALLMQALFAASNVYFKPVKVISCDYDGKELVVVTEAPTHHTEPLQHLLNEADSACVNMKRRVNDMLDILEGIK